MWGFSAWQVWRGEVPECLVCNVSEVPSRGVGVLSSDVQHFVFCFHSSQRWSPDWRKMKEAELTLNPWRGCSQVEPLTCSPVQRIKPIVPPSERHLQTRWGGTAGVVNQAATVHGPATSQHQGLSLTPHVLHGTSNRLRLLTLVKEGTFFFWFSLSRTFLPCVCVAA